MSLQLTSAHLKMSLLTNNPADQSEDILDITNMVLSCADGQDPIQSMREALDADRRKKPLCADLWSMINYLHDSLNRTAAEKTALRKDVLALKAENSNLNSSSVELKEKLLNLQDEVCAYKQTTIAKLQSINLAKSTIPLKYSGNTLTNHGC